MAKTEELQKHTLLLFRDDYRKLQEYYPEIGAAIVVRKLVRKHLTQLDERSTTDTKVEIEGSI